MSERNFEDDNFLTKKRFSIADILIIIVLLVIVGVGFVR